MADRVGLNVEAFVPIEDEIDVVFSEESIAVVSFDPAVETFKEVERP